MLLLPSILALASCLATATVAKADTVTYIVSIVGSGSIGNQTFTDKRITLSAATSTEDLAMSVGGQQGSLSLFGTGFPTSITVQGIGTFGSDANLIYNGDSGPGLLQVRDIDGRLGIGSGLLVTDTPTNLGPFSGSGEVIDSCDPVFLTTPCPGYIGTGDGKLFITSFIQGSGIGQEIFNPVPEPGTFVLLGSGLLAMYGMRRARTLHR
jgi:PEP-CTERM motif